MDQNYNILFIHFHHLKYQYERLNLLLRGEENKLLKLQHEFKYLLLQSLLIDTQIKIYKITALLLESVRK